MWGESADITGSLAHPVRVKADSSMATKAERRVEMFIVNSFILMVAMTELSPECTLDCANVHAGQIRQILSKAVVLLYTVNHFSLFSHIGRFL